MKKVGKGIQKFSTSKGGKAVSGDTTDLRELEKRAERSIMQNLEDSLSLESQESGVHGFSEQHGSSLKKGKK
jgi:hypothetical protein